MRHSLTTFLSSVLALAASGVQAQSIYVDQAVKAPGVCGGALKDYDDKLRRQPLMLRNTSTTNVFVTCAPQQFAEGRNYSITVQFFNQDTTTSTITCTLVSTPGAGTGTPVYSVHQLALLGGATGRMYMNPSVNSYGVIYALSCNLPAAHAMGDIELDSSLDVETQP